MYTRPTLSLPRHFLFMLPASTTAAERDAVIESARRLTSLGYVYIASAHETSMEDREDIRFLPLHADMLPCFGAVTAVCVLRDESIADAARQNYPGTQVIVIDPLSTENVDTEEKSVPAWLASSNVAEISQAA